MTHFVNAPPDLVDLCLLQIEMGLFREELDRAAPCASAPSPLQPDRGIDSAVFRLRSRRADASSQSVMDSRRAACTIARLTEENRGLREMNSAWRGFAFAAGGILLFLLWNALKD